MRTAGTLDRLLLPAVGVDTLSAADLARGRSLEHVLLEHVALSACLATLLLLMIGASVGALWTRWRLRRQAVPFLLLPDWRTAMRVLGLGILLPMAAYYLYTRWSGLAGREFALGYLGQRFILEACLLMTTMLLLSVPMASRAIRRRCEELRVPVPPPPNKVVRAALWLLIVTLWAACLLERSGSTAHPDPAASPLFWTGVALLLIVPFGLGVRWLIGSRKYTLYRGTLARSLTPVLAAAIILLGAIAHPYLSAREVTLVHADDVPAVREDSAGFTPVEALLVQRLKDQVRQAAAELQSHD